MKLLPLSCSLLFLLPLSCFAGSSSLNLANTVNSVASCTISTTQNLQFGSFNPLSETTKNAQGALSLVCSAGTYALSVNYGSGSSVGNVTNRKVQTGCPNGSCFTYTTYDYYCGRAMNGSKGAIPYDIYTNSTMTTEANQKRNAEFYGNTDPTSCSSPTTSFGSVTFTQPGPITVPVYAKMTGTKATPFGSYVDSLVFTVSF